MPLLTLCSLVMICLATANWAFSFGVGTQMVSHWLADKGHTDTTIGLIHAIYYLGVAGASLLVPGLTRSFGLGCALIGIAISCLGLLLFPFTDQASHWFVLRLFSGAGCALTLIPLETMIGRASTPADRTQNFSYYAVALTLGGALGIFAGLHLYVKDQPSVFFWGVASLCLGGFLVYGIGEKALPPESQTVSEPLGWMRNFLSFGTAWSQGFLEGGMLAFLALYLQARGMARETVGTLMGVTMVGVIAFQIPVAWAGDRWGRLRVLLLCYGVVLAGLCVIPGCESLTWTGLWLFAFGAFSGAMYPLGLSLLGERTSEANLPRAYAVYLAMECIGSQLGAAAMGKSRDLWGQNAMFLTGFAAVASVLLCWGVVRVFWKPTNLPQSESTLHSEKRAA